MQCPDCGATIEGVKTYAPDAHAFDPCGCRIATLTAHDMALLDRGRGLATDGGAPNEEDEPKVTAEWLEGRYFCYPIECGVCGDQLAGPEENGVIGRGDAFAIDADGHAVCQHHTDEIRFVAAGVYAHGGGTPCETNRSFRPEDVVTVRGRNDKDDQLVTDGGVAKTPDTDAAGAFSELTEECPDCERETPHAVAVELRTENPDSSFSREPYRVTECSVCGATEEVRLTDA
ncbi:hypothetical protein [Halorussus lipolyticus]|uniref:DUF7835 family putative zinc beta-ribbon protein n=1 Tax=Halorussus lipolyticus TaxID=3034024 RepID=UPI0023E7AA67|nr:hypothetical protein [Halorussus sp. DT80]